MNASAAITETRRNQGVSFIRHLPCSVNFFSFAFVVGFFLTLASHGCSEGTAFQTRSQPRDGGASTQVIGDANQADVVAAGSEALRNYFDTVRAKPNAGVIDAGPALYTRRGGSERIGDQTLKPNNQFRRIGRIWVTTDDGGMTAHCQIKIQRLDTSEYVAMRSNEEFSDLPNSTPIDSDAGLTADQKQVWTDMPRDSGLEREILQILVRRLRGETDQEPSA